MENESAKRLQYTARAQGKNLLGLCGVKIEDDSTIVQFSDDTTKKYYFIEPSSQSTSEINSWQWEEDIFVIDFNVCQMDATLEKIAKELKNAVGEGCSKVIIDARGNGGGNSNACKELLRAMDMDAPGYDMFVRYSKEASAQNGYLRDTGSVYMEGASRYKQNKEVKLVVLSDAETFSSATMLLVWVRDGKLGTIIGEPSSNMPSSYGDIIYFTLDNSAIWGTISHKQFIRPDADNTEKMLMPDILTEPENAMETAILFLQN